MLDLDFILKTIVKCAGGIPETALLVVVAIVVATQLSFFMALVNLKPERLLSRVFKVYISFVRSLPLVLIIYFIYHALPLWIVSFGKLIGREIDVYSIDDMVYGFIVFSFVSIPILSEVFRAGLLAVPKLQTEAAKSIGMTALQTQVHIILPQVIRKQLPVLCTFTTNLIKMTSLAFCMSIREITGEARVAAADSIRYIECYLVIFIMYLVICVAVEQVFKKIERSYVRS
jgi:L-cystine transport system permease protein